MHVPFYHSIFNLQAAVRRSQAASDSDAAARQKIQSNTIASSNPRFVKMPRLGPCIFYGLQDCGDL
jgi:hypothetical protein